MSFFTDASFVMDPNVYGVGKLYVPKPTDGSGDLTFSRASTGTRVNQDGLIEKVRTNLFTYSEQLDNAAWTKADTTIVANVVANPLNGAVTADKMTDSSTSATARYFFQSAASSGTIYTSSGYFKKAEYNFVTLHAYGLGGAVFNLNTGVKVSQSGGVGTITSVGDGWYRCTFSFTAGADTVFFSQSPAGSVTYAGTIGSGIFGFGLQIETGDIATDYIATTTSAVSVGPLANIPRLNYGSDGCPSLLLEPQRTNLATYSEQFDNVAWVKQNAIAVTANTATSPDGYTNADTLEKASGSGGSSYYYIVDASTSNTTNTFSVFAKYKEGSGIIWLLGKNSGTFAYFNLQTGTALSASAGMTTKIENYGNEWYRCSFTQDYTGASDYTFGLGLCLVDGAPNYDATSAATQGAYIYGAQFEAGAYATSYIPTLDSAVTRLVDSASKTGISSLIGQSEGTLYWEGYVTPAGGWNSLLSVEVLGAVFINLRLDPSNQIQLGSGNLSSDIAITGSTPLSSGTYYKIAGAYKSGQNVLYVNGVQIGTSATTFTTPTLSEFRFNVWNVYDEQKRTAQALLFKTRLSNDTLARLTSL